MKKRSFARKISIVLLIIIAIFTMMFMGLLAIIDNTEGYYLSGSDINYTFQNDVLVNNTDINEYETYNIRNQTEFTGHYPATYSFENEVGLIGTQISFVDIYEQTGNSYAKIISEFNNHKNVIDSYVEFTKYVNIRDVFDSQIVGTVELWMCMDTLEQQFFYLQRGNTSVMWFKFYTDGNIHIRNGGDYTIVQTYSINTWYHFKILFNCITDKWDVYIDGILKADNFDFGASSDYISRLSFNSGASANDLHCYIDALGYFWESDYNFESQEGNKELDTSIYPYDSWNLNLGANTYANISNIDGIDNNYLCVIDNAIINQLQVYDNFTSNRQNGTVSFDFRTTNNYKRTTLILSYDTVIGIELISWYGALYLYYHDDIEDINQFICDFDNNTWYNFEIVFNQTFFKFYFDNDYIGTYSINYTTTLNKFWITTGILANNFNSSIDNIRYSWEDYYFVGDNLLSTYSTSNIYEVDKFEFNILSENVLNPNGLDNPNTWTDVESAGDSVNINNGKVYMYQASGYNGIQKAFTDTTNKIFNVSFSIDYVGGLDTITGNTTIKIYSSDSTLITYLNLHHVPVYEQHTIEYYNGTSLVVLNDDYPFDTSVLFLNVYINHYDGICCFRFTQGSTVLRYFVPLIASGKVGLKNVDFINYELSGVLNTPLHLDYIGVYANELSLSNERGYLYQEINDDWNLGHHGLLYINQLTDLFNISVCENEYYLENPDYKHLLGYNALLGPFAGKHYFNVYQNDVYDDACIVVYLKNYIYDVYLGWWEMRGFSTHIQVSGSTLTDDYVPYDDPIFLEFNGTSDYYLVNLFHVENNRLYFNLTCIDTSTEYIQGTFDFTDINCANYSLSLTTRLRGKSFMKGIEYVILGYYTGSDTNILCETSGTKTISQLLKQENLLSSIGFLITDNDNDACSGTTLYGYVDSFKLVYFPNMGYSILSITLIEMMIPLLVIIFPSVGLYVIPKKKQPFVLVLGVAFFSIVCYISSLIPLWLFFIICIALFGVFMGERSSERGDEGW